MFNLGNIDNVFYSKDNIFHQFTPLSNDYYVQFLSLIENVGVFEELKIDSDGNVLVLKIFIYLFHQLRYVTPTKDINYLNISPVQGYNFYCLKIM